MLWIGQFGIADGEAQEHTPWVGAFPDASHNDELSDLYLIVEPALPGSEEFCEELKQAVGELFHEEKLSLTGGILRALRSAHENLREWNRKSIKEHRVAAGVSALAIRPSPREDVETHEAYLAQVAPAAAVLVHEGTVLRLQPRLPDSLEPLGLYDEFRPDFTRLELASGDRLLLLSPALASLLHDEAVQEHLSLPGEDALPAVYRRARSLSNCGALLVAVSAEERPALRAHA